MTPFAGRQKVTSPYGYRADPFGSGRQVWHGGIDVTSQEGRWDVRETTGGTVIEVSEGYNGGRGSLVKVQSGAAVVITQHYERIYVAKGQQVKQGDLLGRAGATGAVTGVHLHFEVQKAGKQVDPAPWLGLPNTLGTYGGNDTLDAWSQPGSGGGPEASGGDELKALAAETAAALEECAGSLAALEERLSGLAGQLRGQAGR